MEDEYELVCDLSSQMVKLAVTLSVG